MQKENNMDKDVNKFFYVDESGNTGTNLFDDKQPFLHYGLISSKVDLDLHAKEIIQRARNYLGVKRLHANELNFKGLQKIINYLYEFDDRFKPHFGVFSVKKIDFALICFFDQVFDQSLNPAITWTGYKTPLRYLLLFKLSILFDIETIKEAWAARIELDSNKANIKVSQICERLLNRIDYIPDARSKTLIYDTLNWAKNNPDKLDYNCHDKDDILNVAPNIIGFQSVMHSIAEQIGSPDVDAKITIDQQIQFNKAQQTLADYYKEESEVYPKHILGPGLPVMDLTNIPKTPLEFKSSTESVGLEIVDIYLWLGRRVIEGNVIKGSLGKWLSRRALSFDEYQVSLEGIHHRWVPFFDKIMSSSTPELEKKGQEMVRMEEERRIHAMNARQNNI